MLDETLVSKLNSIAKTFPLVKPEKESLPCILYQRIDTVQNNYHTGKSLSRPRYQITCLASTKKAANDLATLVKTALDLNKVDFPLAYLINQFDDKEQEEKIFKVILDFYIFIGE